MIQGGLFRATRGLTLGTGFIGATFVLIAIMGLVLLSMGAEISRSTAALLFILTLIQGLTFVLMQYVGDKQDNKKWSSEDDVVYRLRKRSEIRRQIPNRKSVQEGAPDRIADLLDEAADEIEKWRSTK